MARAKVKLDSNKVRHFVAAYNKGTGLVALAAEAGCAIPTIRRVLVEAGVTIRGRGRPVKATA